MVIAKMEEMFRTSFQDMSELTQATQFLHENGKKQSEAYFTLIAKE